MNFQSTADQALDARKETNLSIRYREMHEAVDRAVISMAAMLQANRRWPIEIEEKMKEEKMKEARRRSFDDGAEALLDYDMAGEEQVIDSFAAESQGASASEGPTVSAYIDFEGYGKILLPLLPLDLIFNSKFQSDDALLDLLATEGPDSPKASWERFFQAFQAMWYASSLQKHEPVEKDLEEVWKAWKELQAAATDARMGIESEGQNSGSVLLNSLPVSVLDDDRSSVQSDGSTSAHHHSSRQSNASHGLESGPKNRSIVSTFFSRLCGTRHD